MIIIDLLIGIFALDGALCLFSPRVRTLNRAFFGLFVGKVEGDNIEALIDLAKEDLNANGKKFNVALDEHSGQAELLITDVNSLSQRYHQIEQSVNFYLGKGDETNAGKFAAQLETLGAELSTKQEALKVAETTYKDLLATRDAAIRQSQQTLDDLASRAKTTALRNKTAELQENAAALKSSFSQSGSNLARISDIVAKQEAVSKGRANRVNHDVAEATGNSLDIPIEVTQSSALERFKAHKAQNDPKQLNAPVEQPVLQINSGVKSVVS